MFTILSGVSLLLFVAVCVMWVRSYGRCYSAQLIRNGERVRAWELRSQSGCFAVAWFHMDQDLTKMTGEGRRQTAEAETKGYSFTFSRLNFDPRLDEPKRAVRAGGITFMGFSAAWSGRNPQAAPWVTRQRSGMLSAPYWFLAMVLGGVPLLYVYVSRRKRRREGDNVCRVCGYDLRATPERCPECGAGRAEAIG